MVAWSRVRRWSGTALVALGLWGAGVTAAQGQEDPESITRGVDYFEISAYGGYVAGRGTVLFDDGSGNRVPKWAEYEQDQLIPDGQGNDDFVSGTVVWEALAVDKYKDAQVISRDEYLFYQNIYRQLAEDPKVQPSPVSKFDYVEGEFVDNAGNVIPRVGLKASTTHVMVRVVSERQPGQPLIVQEFPFNPMLAPATQTGDISDCPSCPRTFSVGTQAIELGVVLRESPGVITYLADFITPVEPAAAGDPTGTFGSCSRARMARSRLAGRPTTGETICSRFQTCDLGRIGAVWAPMQGAYVDSASRWMYGNAPVRTDGAGHYYMEYPHGSGRSFYDNVYVTLNFAPFQPRVAFGNRYLQRRSVVAGKSQTVNIGIAEAAYVLGTVFMVNEARPQVPLDVAGVEKR